MDSSNISPYQSSGVLKEHESGVFIMEFSHTWKEELQGASYCNDMGEMTFMIKDTTEVTMEMKNFPSIGDPSGHLPYVGGLDEHVTIAEFRSSGGFVSVNKRSGAGPPVFTGATPGITHVADATALTSTDPPVIDTWNSDSGDVPLAKTRENIFIESDNGDPSKSHATAGPTPLTNAVKGRPMVTNDFYHEPFIFMEMDRDVGDLVASPFTIRIWAEFLGIRQ
ncbi:hypothetical protein Tco_0172872 [Tanacetum coccineum]